MSNCEIVCPQRKQTLLLANFTNGSVIASRAHTLKLGCFQCGEADPKKKKKRKIMVADTEKLSYVGQNFGPYASKASTVCKNYVGILDKKSGKMKICDTEFFQMHPKPPRLDEEERTSSSIALPGGDAELSYRDKSDLLTEAFGSKKKKSAMESRHRNKIHDAALEESLKSSIGSAMSQTNTGSSNANEENTGLSIPPFNKDAERPEDVYKLKDIISDQEMDALTNPAKEFFECDNTKLKEWKAENKYPLFVLNHLSTLPQNEEGRWRKAKCLMYLCFLIELYRMKVKDLRKKDPFPDTYPKPVVTQLKDRFTLLVEASAGKASLRCMPARLKDKLVSYILVLSLILDEHSVEMSDLQMDLKIGAQRLITHFKSLGCVVKIQKEKLPSGEPVDIKIAILKVPLTFPELSVKNKKNRR